MRAVAPAVVAVLIAVAAAAQPVEVTVEGMALDPNTGSPVVRLVEKGKGRRELPIWIGPFEAQAIALEIHGVPPLRPRRGGGGVSAPRRGGGPPAARRAGGAATPRAGGGAGPPRGGPEEPCGD